MVKYLSTSRLDNTGLAAQPYQERPYSANGFDSYQRQPYRPTFLTSQPYLPTDPWPRKKRFHHEEERSTLFISGKCILIRDPSFHGCGFRMIEKENYDTPIVLEVRNGSPAKRRYAHIGARLLP